MGINFRTETLPRRLHLQEQPGAHPALSRSRSTKTATCTRSTSSRMCRAEGQRARAPDRRRRALRLRDARPRAGAGRGPAALPVAAAHDAGRLGPARTPDDVEGAQAIPSISRCTRDGDQLALDQPPARHRPEVHLRRRLHAALRADGIHHPPEPGRLLHPRPARRQSLDGRRHRHHPGRLVARLRHRHELLRVARAGAAGA